MTALWGRMSGEWPGVLFGENYPGRERVILPGDMSKEIVRVRDTHAELQVPARSGCELSHRG